MLLRTVRCFGLAFGTAAVGAFAAIEALRILHPWAYSTELPFHIRITFLHALLFAVILWIWFSFSEPKVTTMRGLLAAIAAALIAGLSAVLLGVYGAVQVVSGQAFIASFVAVALYCLIAHILRFVTRTEH